MKTYIPTPQLINVSRLYTCRIIIPGTCFDVTSEFRLRGKDFGCYAQLGDFVWNDTDHDGIQDSGEVGVAGVTVNLYDNTNAPVSSTVTDAYGKYLFTWLNPGTYHVGFSLPSNYVFSPKDQVGTDATDSDPDVNSGLTGNYILIAGDSNMTVDAGIYLNDIKASIGDIVWNDLNNDGIQDINELGVPGVTVTLYDSIGGFINSKVTDALGNYIFTGLDAGRYQIGFSNLPSGFSFSTANQGLTLISWGVGI